MQVAVTFALLLAIVAAPAEDPPPATEGRDPAPPQLPALDLPEIDRVENPLVPPPPASSEQGDQREGQAPPRADGAEGELRPVALPTHADGSVAPRGRRSRRDRAAMARLRLIDLRDPFERSGRPGGINRTLTAKFILPDLKDPFAIKRRPRPKNWSAPELPVDIRDPFSGSAVTHHRPGCAPIRTKTEEGVSIQRPNAAKKQAEAEERRRREQCEELEQRDLRDPFNSR